MVDLTPILNEEEKLHRLKSWLKKYGNFISVLVVVFLGLIVGWQFWQRHQLKQAEEASMIYDTLVMSVNNNDATHVNERANDLMNHYPQTPYAKLAAFMLAKDAVKQNKLDSARKYLQWIIQRHDQAIFTQLAQLRLARILIEQNKSKDAIDVLAGAGKMYPGMTNVIRARALLALGKTREARQALQQAMQVVSSDSFVRPILEMQLYDM